MMTQRKGDPRSASAHFGDPCIFCKLPLEELLIGPCPRNDGRLRIAGYAQLDVRWDGYATYRFRTTDGYVRETVRHISEHAPYFHFGLSEDLIATPPLDMGLKTARVTV